MLALEKDSIIPLRWLWARVISEGVASAGRLGIALEGIPMAMASCMRAEGRLRQTWST